jgi:hypothetical protein
VVRVCDGVCAFFDRKSLKLGETTAIAGAGRELGHIAKKQVEARVLHCIVADHLQTLVISCLRASHLQTPVISFTRLSHLYECHLSSAETWRDRLYYLQALNECCMRLHLGNDDLAFAIRFNHFKDIIAAHLLSHFCFMKSRYQIEQFSLLICGIAHDFCHQALPCRCFLVAAPWLLHVTRICTCCVCTSHTDVLNKYKFCRMRRPPRRILWRL